MEIYLWRVLLLQLVPRLLPEVAMVV